MDPLTNNRKELAELHFHIGQSVEPSILWSIAHQQGIKLPSKDYWEFHDLITLNKPHVSWKDYHSLYHLTELIQSSPDAIERSVYATITGAYRVNNTTLLEPSFNPMLRNRGGERDLDQIILGALHGMEKALIEFPQIRAGLIFTLDKRLSFAQNKVIVEKAIKYHRRGVVGIDIAGVKRSSFDFKDYTSLFAAAHDAGLKTTIHIGEEGDISEMEYALKHLKVDRINHGIRAVESKSLLSYLRKQDLTLCICPHSNLRVGFVKDIYHLKKIIQTLWSNEVKFCINTDSPAMFKTTLKKEIQLMIDYDILTPEQIDQTVKWAFAATFINSVNLYDNLYLGRQNSS